MIEGKSILAVVPARGGSKGVPLKNIRTVLGIPLIAYTARTIKACTFIDRAVVSTDHSGIARLAESEGLFVPFLRPKHLSGDRIGDMDVLAHALIEMERLDSRQYDIVLMLQPTSPLRTPAVLQEVVTKLVQEDLDSVWTLSPTDLKFHPQKQMRITNGVVEHYESMGKEIVARQQLETLYHRNGVAYAITRSCIVERRSILGVKASGVIVEGPIANIDTLEDFEALEQILGKQLGPSFQPSNKDHP